MTLVVALKSVDGIAIAADSRTTIGDPRGVTAMNDTANKLVKLNDQCALVLSGSAELANSLVDDLQREIGGKRYSINKYAAEASQKFRKSYAEWFKGTSPELIPQTYFILAGLEKQNDSYVPRTYLLSSPANFALQLATDGCMMAGVVQYAIYLKHRFYDSNMGVAQAQRLAIYLITETATQDPKVGGPIKAAQITPESYKQLSDEEIASIVRDNEEQNKTLKSFFAK